MSVQPLDLTSPAVTCRLLLDPLSWRERAVESLVIGSAHFVARERSVQCRPLFPVIADLVPRGGLPSSEAFVALPLGLLPKQPLLEFGLDGPAGQPVLLSRPDIALRESALVLEYARQADLPVSVLLDRLLPVLLGFTEGAWAAVKADASRRDDPLVIYLREGLSNAPSPDHVHDLRRLSDRAYRALEPFNESATNSTSAAESPFLIVPVLVEGGHVADLAEAVQAVTDYACFVEAATALTTANKPSAAGDLVSVLADYGRYWELMALAQVPLDRPFIMTYRHLDPVPVRGWRNTVTPTVVIADATSTHVSIRVDDPATMVKGVTGHNPRTGQPAYMGSTSRQTIERHAFYVWEVDVDFRVLLHARLSVIRRVAVANMMLTAIILLTSLSLFVRAPTTISELAVVSGPVAAAASLLLLREPSTLASRLRRCYSLAVAVSIGLLIIVTIWRFTTLP